MNKIAEHISTLKNALNKNLKGKETAITLSLMSILSKGHILIEDIPGLGKTTLALMLSKSMDLNFGRVQGTNDLLPADILGYNIYAKELGNFEFRKGPIFNNILLFDEINRASPKTQSALLEAMEENQVSIEGTTYKLPYPFFVIATENPYEEYGTFPLPESELDRFQMRLNIGYPPKDIEKAILKEGSLKDRLFDLKPVIGIKELTDAIDYIKDNVYVSEQMFDYILAIALSTRESRELTCGLSTRACLDIASLAKASAFIGGREYVIPEDVLNIAKYTMLHRLVFKETSNLIEKEETLLSIIKNVKLPL